MSESVPEAAHKVFVCLYPTHRLRIVFDLPDGDLACLIATHNIVVFLCGKANTAHCTAVYKCLY